MSSTSTFDQGVVPGSGATQTTSSGPPPSGGGGGATPPGNSNSFQGEQPTLLTTPGTSAPSRRSMLGDPTRSGHPG
ncbi:unnamed protein product, partial [Amoebophrya sp. A120]|eukprot:GSA120T00019969001.1